MPLVEQSNGWDEWIDSYAKHSFASEPAQLAVVEGEKGKPALKINSGDQVFNLGDWEERGLPTYYLNNLSRLTVTLHSHEEFNPYLPDQTSVTRRKLVVNGFLPEVQIPL